MLKFVTEAEYRELLGTDSIPNDFNNLVIEASYIINKDYIINVANISEEVKYATCKIIEILDNTNTKKSEIGNLKGTNIEGWSEDYKTDEEIEVSLKNQIEEILLLYLGKIPRRTKGVILYE